jgi:hypothetical protein
VEDVGHHSIAEDTEGVDLHFAGDIEGADLHSARGTKGDTDSAPGSTGYAVLGSSVGNLTVS